MGLGIRIIVGALRGWSERFDKMLVANFISVLAGLPLFVIGAYFAYSSGAVLVGALVTSVLVGILPNPGSAGIQLMAQDMADGELLLMPGPLQGLREYWKESLRVWAVSLIVTVVLVFNVLFYANMRIAFAPIIEIIALYLCLMWLAMHLYVYPLILRQEDRRLRTLYRNAFVMTITHPVVTLEVFAVWVVILMVASATGLIVAVGTTIAASVQQQAATTLLRSFRRDPTGRADAESP